MSITDCPDLANGGSAIPANGIDLGPGRRRVTQQDLNMYQALVGRQQQIGAPEEPARVTDPLDPDDGDEPSERTVKAKIWKRAGQGLGGGLVDPMLRSIPPSAGQHGGRTVQQPWSPSALCMNIADYCDDLSVRIRRPHFSDWVKRLTRKARLQLSRAQARIASPWGG